MKKFFSVLFLSAVLLCTIAFTSSCTNGKAQGKKDGEAYCDCLKKSGFNESSRLSYATKAAKQGTEYQNAFAEAAALCLLDGVWEWE